MSRPVFLIGFQDQGNLGIGYLASTLIDQGYDARVIDFRNDPEHILEAIKATRPLLVGFSLIFQYYAPQFASLASYLRSHGVDCHFSTGGHYPSLRHEDVLEMVPELDSVVRFEGEVTLLELVQRLSEGRDWRQTVGIAYRQDGRVIATPLRPLIADLDRLPWPYRPFEPKPVLGRKAIAILASRGCVRGCSFCSIRKFYQIPPGKIRRTRSPENVVREMKALHDERRISIFLFQDDDFSLLGRAGRRWALDFVNELERQGLRGRVIWKISCRADEVEPELFARLRDAGLFLVYLGLESGNEVGLQLLNKKLAVTDSHRAVAVLKELGIMFDFGFMLFDPSSTFEAVRANTAFLRHIVGDGSAAVVFGKMMPYAGTDIEKQLAQAGRLRGNAVEPDYDFLDPRLNAYFEALAPMVAGWVQSLKSVASQLNWAWVEIAVIERLFPPVDGLESYKAFLRSITSASNDLLLTTIEETSRLFEDGSKPRSLGSELELARQRFLTEMLRGRDEFIGHNQDILLQSLAEERAARQG